MDAIKTASAFALRRRTLQKAAQLSSLNAIIRKKPTCSTIEWQRMDGWDEMKEKYMMSKSFLFVWKAMGSQERGAAHLEVIVRIYGIYRLRQATDESLAISMIIIFITWQCMVSCMRTHVHTNTHTHENGPPTAHLLTRMLPFSNHLSWLLLLCGRAEHCECCARLTSRAYVCIAENSHQNGNTMLNADGRNGLTQMVNGKRIQLSYVKAVHRWNIVSTVSTKMASYWQCILPYMIDANS